MFILFFPVIYTRLSSKDIINKIYNKSASTEVLDMWHIEAFEGGNSARKGYLDKLIKTFSKANRGVYISLKVMSLSEYELNIKQNPPDIISFTRDCKDVEKYLTSLPRNKNINKDFLQAISFQDEIICYPYMLGRYAIISYKENPLESILENSIVKKSKTVYPFGFAKNVASESVLKYNNITFDSVKQSETQYENYTAFLKGEITTMLGSQRDVHRLKAREEKGSINSLYYTYLEGYTDLVQYIGVVENKENMDIALAFADFLISASSQRQLSSCGMFSPYLKIYESGYMKDWEKCVKSTKIPNLF